MKFRFEKRFAVFAIYLCATAKMFSAITYIDATITNTTVNGAALIAGSNYTTGAGIGAADNLWHLRTSTGNGNSLWTADDAAAEEVAPLITTISFPEPGGYRLFAYIWDSEKTPAEDWDVKVRVGTTGGFSKIQASEIEMADAVRFTGAVVVTNAPEFRLMQIPLGVVNVAASGTAQIYVDDDDTFGSRNTQYDGVGFEKVFSTLGPRVIALDCNKTNVAGAPAQAMFRSISGSSTTSQNSTNITKLFGAYTIQISKTNATGFDFRGPNGDATHIIPGGATSLPFLVADFLGTRDGTINLSISNLAAGTYLFRSYHLDTFNGANFGFAQGANSTSQNTLRAHIAGALEAIVQPTALSTVGLNTTFISDADIPTLSFPFTANGSNAVTINLSTVYTNGVDRFIFLNGFEIFSTTP